MQTTFESATRNITALPNLLGHQPFISCYPWSYVKLHAFHSFISQETPFVRIQTHRAGHDAFSCTFQHSTPISPRNLFRSQNGQLSRVDRPGFAPIELECITIYGRSEWSQAANGSIPYQMAMGINGLDRSTHLGLPDLPTLQFTSSTHLRPNSEQETAIILEL